MTNFVLSDPPDVDELRSRGVRPNEIRIISAGSIWWRVHSTVGAHVLAWNEFRRYGPLFRFDPHPQPVATHPNHGIWYAAQSPISALAETFGADRTIYRTRGAPHLTGIQFTRDLTLLDVAPGGTGSWPTRAGATFALSTAPHTETQPWARAVAAAFPDLDGIHYSSRLSGERCIALYLPAITAIPAHPVFSQPLTAPGLQVRITTAADAIGYAVD